MSYKDKLDNCLISLDVGEKNALLIVLARDGTICRHGNGNPARQMETLKGVSDLEHFQAFMMTVPEHLFGFSGVFEQTPIVGRPCKLMIVFSGPDGEEAGFKCNYGEDSVGPPRELTEMVINAVKITDGWYESERQHLKKDDVSGSGVRPLMRSAAPPNATSEAAWWQFWK